MDALSFLELKKLPELQPLYVLAGDEQLLKRMAWKHLRQRVLGEEPDELADCQLRGDDANFATVNDELLTKPFLSERKLVTVEEADGFVSAHRDKLERYLDKPSRVGILVLAVKSWKSNTRLAKIVPASATIVCEPLKTPMLRGWLTRRAQDLHGQKLEPAAADLLVSLAGNDLGILDQEVAKLATYVGAGQPITAKAVDELVGQSRMESAWQMLDQVSAGQGGAALVTLHQLLRQGDDVHKILGAMSYQLRKLAQVSRLLAVGRPLGDAVAQAGLPPFKRDATQQALRRFGAKTGRFYDLLLACDSTLKSSDRLTDHGVMERLLVELSR